MKSARKNDNSYSKKGTRRVYEKVRIFITLCILISLFSGCGSGIDILVDESNIVTKNEERKGEDITYEIETNEVTTEEATTEDLLEECDEILCSGNEVSGDTYYLVANQEETYDDVVIEIGVVKNNSWLIEPTTKSPFLNEEGLFKRYSQGLLSEDDELNEKIGAFVYIGNGCFYYDCNVGANGGGIIYNSESKKYKDIIPVLISYGPEGFEAANIVCQRASDGKILTKKFSEEDDDLSGTLCILDINTLKEKDTRVEFYWKDIIYPYGEGLFAILDEYNDEDEKNGFYNETGKKVIDLSKYVCLENIVSNRNTSGIPRKKVDQLVFSDNECTFTVTNKAGNRFKITINKKGKVINQEQVYDEDE